MFPCEAASINVVGLLSKHKSSISVNISHQIKHKKADQRNINSFVIITMAAEEAALNIQLARYMYSSNSPFA